MDTEVLDIIVSIRQQKASKKIIINLGLILKLTLRWGEQGAGVWAWRNHTPTSVWWFYPMHPYSSPDLKNLSFNSRYIRYKIFVSPS